MSEIKKRAASGKTVIGIDVGGSTTKIVGFTPDKNLIQPQIVKANDPITSVYGAFGKFTVENGIGLKDIDRIMMTGVGSAFLKDPIYSLRCEPVSEFDSIGIGGLYLSGLDEAIIVSMGTGTAITHAKKTDGVITTEYLGGTGVGGGTITGLAKKMVDIDSVRHLATLSEEGDLSKIDLRVKDIANTKTFTDLKSDLTASNFGKASDMASRSDIALGIINMVSETVAMMSIFASRSFGTKDIVLTGNLTAIDPIRKVFDQLAPVFGVNFIFPEYSQFATVIGAALQ